MISLPDRRTDIGAGDVPLRPALQAPAVSAEVQALATNYDPDGLLIAAPSPKAGTRRNKVGNV